MSDSVTAPGNGIQPGSGGDAGRAGEPGPAGDKSAGRARKSAAALFMLFFAAAFFGSLAVDPSPSGIGSHTQLGLPPCGFFVATGIPCFSCGMTTAFAHMARGSVASGFAAQPFAALLFIGGAVCWMACAWSLATGFDPFAWLERRAWKIWGPAIAALAAGSWIYKIIATR